MAKTSLNKWLKQCGFTDNPFELSNAEYEAQVPEYFVDNIEFDEILHSKKPCVVFAARGSGKTALRQMLSAEFRKREYLVIPFTYQSYERILMNANHQLGNIQISHYIDSILNSAILAMPVNKIFQGYADHEKELLHYLRAFAERFAPEATLADDKEYPSGLLKNFSDYQLLVKFVTLIQEFGYKACVVLVDNLDEFFISNGEYPNKNIVSLLAPLLGTLPILECPGMMFRFFLPDQIENDLRKTSWFRPDRLHLSSILWNKNELKKLIQNRISYYSNGRYPTIASLCKDDLSLKIEDELIWVAKSVPRFVIEIAYQLFQNHVLRDDPGFQISLETWKETKKNLEMSKSEQGQSGIPELVVNDTIGEVWLGNKELRKKITPQDYRVLLCLYTHRPESCSKKKIVEEAWQGMDGVSDDAITASIKRLRDLFRKVEGFEDFVVIDTIRGADRKEGAYKIPKPIYHKSDLDE